jgi:hypothetical protein
LILQADTGLLPLTATGPPVSTCPARGLHCTDLWCYQSSQESTTNLYKVSLDLSGIAAPEPSFSVPIQYTQVGHPYPISKTTPEKSQPQNQSFRVHRIPTKEVGLKLAPYLDLTGVAIVRHSYLFQPRRRSRNES